MTLLVALLFYPNSAQCYNIEQILSPSGAPFVQLNIMQSGETSTAFGATTAQRELSADELNSFRLGMLYWQSIIGDSLPGSLPIIDIVPMAARDDNASAYSPLDAGKTHTYLAEAFLTGLDPSDVNQVLAAIEVDRASPESERWVTDRLPILPDVGKESDLPGTVLHEMFHALGLACFADEFRFTEMGNWTAGLHDYFGTQAQLGMPLAGLTSPEDPHDANSFYMLLDNYGGAYFTGTHVQEVLNGALLAWPDDSTTPAVPGLPVNGFEDKPEMSHIELQNSLMSHQGYRNWCTLLEAELAVVQDLGFNVDRRRFFGYSIYGSGTEDALAFTDNTSPFYARNSAGNGWLEGVPSDQSWGIGLHIYGSWNDVRQSADLLSTGDYAMGIRVDGVGNRLLIAPDVRIQADGVGGNGLAVTYGRDHNIISQGDVQALGRGGVAARFDFGSNELGDSSDYRGSYIRGSYTSGLGWRDDSMPSALNGPLVRNFDVTGRLAGEHAAIYISPNALVQNINIMRGAILEGDIISEWNPTQPLYSGLSVQAPANTNLVTELAFGRLPDSTGAATERADDSFAMSYSGNIKGAAGLQMNVAGGFLSYNGVADVLGANVAESARLGGTGTLNIGGGMGWLVNAGTIAPGNSIGTLTVNGNFVQTTSGTLEMEVSESGKHDVLNVSGNAELNGTLQFIQQYGLYTASQLYKMDALVPVGNTLSNNLVDVSFVGIPSPTFCLRVDAAPDKSSFIITPVRNLNAYSQYATTKNGERLGEALGNIVYSAKNDMRNLFLALDYSSADGSDVRSATKQLSPAGYASAATAALSLQGDLTNMVLTEFVGSSKTANLAAGDEPADWRAFARAYGGARHQGSGNGMDGWKGRYGGVLGGITRTQDGLSLGAHVAGGARSVRGDVNGKLNGEGFWLGGHARFAPENWNGWNLFGVGRVGLETQRLNRRVEFNGYAREAKSDWTSFSGGLRVGGGYAIELGSSTLEPFVALDYAGLFQPSVKENNGEGVRLRVDDSDYHSLRSVLGMRLESGAAAFGSGNEVRASVHVSWNHELLGHAGTARASFVDAPGYSFDHRADFYGRDSVSLGASATVTNLARDLSLIADVGAELGEYQGHDVHGGLSLSWKW